MIRNIYILLLYLTLGYTQVSIFITNVDTSAGTLDIYMTNQPGCSYCTDPVYDNQEYCENFGDDGDEK